MAALACGRSSTSTQCGVPTVDKIQPARARKCENPQESPRQAMGRRMTCRQPEEGGNDSVTGDEGAYVQCESSGRCPM
eukprot:1558825-Rhodomonas_salina.3